MSGENYNLMEDGDASMVEKTYYIFLNIIEGIDFHLNDGVNEVINEDVILVKVSLNGVLFEVLGNIMPQNSVVFNNNCIWECDLDDVKRIKADNRPIKIECFLRSFNSTKGTTKQIGTLLLPLRCVQINHDLSKLQIKPHWHNLHNLSFKWRNSRPQIYLMLVIVKKTIVDQMQLAANLDMHNTLSADSSNNKNYFSSNVSQTLYMLQSQQNIYVQLLEEIGQIQVGNDPDIDCDIFCVTITFKNIKYISTLLDFAQKFRNEQCNSFIFQYDFLGSISSMEIVINNNDCYTINQKLSLHFRSSLKNLKLYFQKIFYIPINLYYLNENISIANYRFEISQFLPDDIYYFNDDNSKLWITNSLFHLNGLSNISNTKTLQPSMEFIISLELLTKCDQDQDNYVITHAETANQAIDLLNENNDCTEIVSEYLQFEKPSIQINKVKYILWRSSTKRHSNIQCGNYDASISSHNTRVVGVNTEEYCNVLEHNEMFLKSVHELNNWKQQEMKRIIYELTNLNHSYMQKVQTRWEDKISQLETKISKFEELNTKLEKIQAEHSAILGISFKNEQITHIVSREIESNYRKIIIGLEKEMKSLLLRTQENEKEINALKEHTNHLGKHLVIFQNNILIVNEFKDVLKDMRIQAERFIAMQNVYKEQGYNIMLETNALKLKLSKLFNARKQFKNNEVNLCLDEILNEKIIGF